MCEADNFLTAHFSVFQVQYLFLLSPRVPVEIMGQQRVEEQNLLQRGDLCLSRYRGKG